MRKRRQGRANYNSSNGIGRLTACSSTTVNEGSPLGSMTFILAPTRADRFFSAVADQFQTTKIFQNRRAATTKHLDAFL